jgi:hypothetical protein
MHLQERYFPCDSEKNKLLLLLLLLFAFKRGERKVLLRLCRSAKAKMKEIANALFIEKRKIPGFLTLKNLID